MIKEMLKKEKIGLGRKKVRMIYALGIGSNSNSRFGNKLNTLKFVLKELERNNIKVIKKSKLYSSPPKNFKTAAETFLNAALVVETKLKPKNLLIILKKLKELLEDTPTVRILLEHVIWIFFCLVRPVKY